MRREVFEGHDIFTVAEANGVSPEELADWVGEKGVFSMLFEFSHMGLQFPEGEEIWCRAQPWKLTALKQEMHASLDGVPHKDIVTFHEAFPYFAEEFGLHIIGVIEREPGSEPTPEELETTIDQVNELPVKVLFTEPQYSPSAAETIARETGAKIYELDPVVTGEATPDAMDAYLDAMRKNMEVLKQALQ